MQSSPGEQSMDPGTEMYDSLNLMLKVIAGPFPFPYFMVLQILLKLVLVCLDVTVERYWFTSVRILTFVFSILGIFFICHEETWS